jgi:hypothetical protein
MKKAQGRWWFWVGISLLAIPGLVHAYLLMPFPGSQDLDAFRVSFYLEKVVLPLRIAGALVILWYCFKYYGTNTLAWKIVKPLLVIGVVGSFYFTDVEYKAEKMFAEPQVIRFVNAKDNVVPDDFVVIGVESNGVAKAYPLVYLGYHHKVQDNVGTLPVLVTYCTMCRTGRVYSPVINGKRENFRLVGARHYNAIIEDEGTKTWWYQATGIAAAGKLKGQKLTELPYEQATLHSWLSRHPKSLILQPDEHYLADYNDLKNYDRLQPIDKDSTQKNKDTLLRKSWTVGVIVNGQPKAYDWRRLFKKTLVNDKITSTPVVLAIEPDSLTYHVFNSEVKGQTLHFKLDTAGKLTDVETASVWDWDGMAVSGAFKGDRLGKIQAYQEYWHSWKHFHPNTLFWKE